MILSIPMTIELNISHYRNMLKSQADSASGYG
jgi:hypothetical protein